MTDDRFLPGGWSETFMRCFHAVYSLFPLEHRNIRCVQVSRHWDTPVHAAVFILWVEMTNADDEFEAAGSLIGLMSVNMMWITSSSLQSAASQPDWTSVGDLSVTTAIIKLWTSEYVFRKTPFIPWTSSIGGPELKPNGRLGHRGVVLLRCKIRDPTYLNTKCTTFADQNRHHCTFRRPETWF